MNERPKTILISQSKYLTAVESEIFHNLDTKCRGGKVILVDYISVALPTHYQHQTCDDNLTLNGALSNNYFENSIENKQGRSLLKRKMKGPSGRN